MLVKEKTGKKVPETQDLAPAEMPEAVQRFVLHWGEMGNAWGVNRSVAQIHALLFISDDPLTSEAIARPLALARSNVSNSLKELIGWGLIKRVPVFGDRRDYYTAESDMFEMVRRIAAGRKARELDPTLDVLRECVALAEDDPQVSRAARKRLGDMLSFSDAVDKGFEEILRLPAPTLMALIRMGGTVAKYVSPRAGGLKGKSAKR